jgi:subtilisin family serine protease
VATIAPSAARAGDALRFKHGTVRTSSFSAMPPWLRDSANGSDASRARYFVVQFKSTIGPADHALLAAQGATEMRYVPDDALIIRVSGAAAQALASASGVRAVVPYNSRWKMSEEVAPSVFIAQAETELLVRLFAESEAADVSAQIAALPGAQVRGVSGKSIAVALPVSQVGKLVEIEGVEWAQAMPRVTTLQANVLDDDPAATPPAEPNGDYSDLDGYETGTKVMKFDVAWARGYSGTGQIGSMSDTGLDTGNIDTLPDGFKGRIYSGYAFGLFAQTWNDPMGHGTHVAGSVVGAGGPSGDKIRGGAYGAQFVAEGLWSPMLNNLSVPQKLADLFSKAKADGATVHTNSWGSQSTAYDGMSQQVDEYMFQNQDFLVLFAAGNSGVDKDKDGRIDPGSVSSPSTAKNCLTVGASKNLVSKFGIQKKMSDLRNGKENWGVEPIASSKLSENVDGMAAFSSRGPTQDGRIKPEIVAPGTNILSNRSHEKGAEPLWGPYNADYTWSGGTSMATPLTAGAALVARQYLVSGKGIAQPSAALLKATLLHSAYDMFPGQFGAVGKDQGQELLTKRPTPDAGFGRVDMDRATSLDGAQLIDEKAGVAVGETKTYSFTAASAGQLTATLVWIDAPAADSASKALVNDLDLFVVDPSGAETTLHDAINNTEMIEMPATAGTYKIRVQGTNVPQGLNGKQPFALIVGVK